MGRRRSKPDPERLILNLRLKDLNRLIAHRHGGDAANYTLPDDDAAREYLYILISHYANVDPNAPRRIIKLRAPWMSVDEAERVIDMAFSYQRRWRSSTLGRELNYSEAEWHALRLRTVGPTGMTPEERRRISDTARKERARRRKGAKTRAHYEGASLSRQKPWEKEGISRASWYRRNRETSCSAISLIRADGLVSQGRTLGKAERGSTPGRAENKQARAVKASGNPNGRPVGHRTRHQFSAAFAVDLAEVWAEHGKSSMLHTARSNPETFFAVCSKLVPKDVELTIRQNYSGGLDERDLQILRAIRDAIPNANELEPQAVLQYALDAIRSYDARVITADVITEGQNSQNPN